MTPGEYEEISKRIQKATECRNTINELKQRIEWIDKATYEELYPKFFSLSTPRIPQSAIANGIRNYWKALWQDEINKLEEAFRNL